ncbi:hypothetical protein CDAR_280451 [Caerostris darwini]|uniref:Uncharacterized protein n=1 Tax=Caerostris darwini TaxID=1538125 RepID=A0AAV4VG50_9ARAC|nr:hypothetical protein CDAR_280451 [Caerostris darwini]
MSFYDKHYTHLRMLTTFEAFLSFVAQASQKPENKPIEASAPLKCVGSLQLMRCLKAILKILNVLIPSSRNNTFWNHPQDIKCPEAILKILNALKPSSRY